MWEFFGILEPVWCLGLGLDWIILVSNPCLAIAWDQDCLGLYLPTVPNSPTNMGLNKPTLPLSLLVLGLFLSGPHYIYFISLSFITPPTPCPHHSTQPTVTIFSSLSLIFLFQHISTPLLFHQIKTYIQLQFFFLLCINGTFKCHSPSLYSLLDFNF